jgi:hypothetical protein
VLPLPFDKVCGDFCKGFKVAKTFEGLSSVLVNVPPPTVKLLPLPDWSVHYYHLLK